MRQILMTWADHTRDQGKAGKGGGKEPRPSKGELPKAGKGAGKGKG